MGPLASRLSPPQPWQAKNRSAHHTEWTSIQFVTNPITHQVSVKTNAFIELGNDLNIQDQRGRWKPADPSFAITDRGVEARGTAHKVTLAPNINTAGSIELQRGETTLKSHPLCVGYYDPVDGRSVLLAELTSSVGWLVSTNEVVYSNCFDGLRASIRIRNSRSGMSQELLLHERPDPPSAWGLSASARLELFTELLPGSPAPEVKTQVLTRETDAAKRQTMVEPDFTDASLNFQQFRMVPGKAFMAEQSATTLTNRRSRSTLASVPVGKRYAQTDDGRIVLIEAVEFERVRPMLTNLLPVESFKGVTNAALTRPAGTHPSPQEPLGARTALSARTSGHQNADEIVRAPVQSEMASQASIGHPRPSDGRGPEGEGSPDRISGLAHSRSFTLPAQRLAHTTTSRMRNALLAGAPASGTGSPRPSNGRGVGGEGNSAPRLANLTPPSTFILDYETLNNIAFNNYVFAANTNYVINGTVQIGPGPAVFEGRCILKYHEYASIEIQGTVDFQTDPFNPAIFTSIHDDTVGTAIPGSSGDPTYSRMASPAVRFTGTANREIKHMRISSAHRGIEFATPGTQNTIKHAQIVNTWDSITLLANHLKLYNVLAANVDQVVNGYSFNVDAQHLTANTAFSLGYCWYGDPNLYGDFYAVNCLIVNIPDEGFIAPYTPDASTRCYTGEEPAFQTVGAGSHYLANDTYRNTGTTTGVDPDLLEEIRERTRPRSSPARLPAMRFCRASRSATPTRSTSATIILGRITPCA